VLDALDHMIATTASATDWDGYIAADFVFADYPPGSRVLDVGFGGGEQMKKLMSRGCRAFGIEYDPGLAARAAASGLPVSRAQAEHLPFASASLDGLLCKVVIPYTDEARAIAEIGRVLRPGAVARVSYHGLGYSLRYLLTERNWKRRVYGARVILNTWVYAVSGRRLPGFWGDTVYQSRTRLRRYYERSGLELLDERPPGRFAGAPVFLYHTLRRTS
jgi:SAM-dependent methyltransferase